MYILDRFVVINCRGDKGITESTLTSVKCEIVFQKELIVQSNSGHRI